MKHKPFLILLILSIFLWYFFDFILKMFYDILGYGSFLIFLIIVLTTIKFYFLPSEDKFND